MLDCFAPLQFCSLMLIFSCLPTFHNTENYKQLFEHKIISFVSKGWLVSGSGMSCDAFLYKTGAGAYGLYFLQSGFFSAYLIS